MTYKCTTSLHKPMFISCDPIHRGKPPLWSFTVCWPCVYRLCTTGYAVFECAYLVSSTAVVSGDIWLCTVDDFYSHSDSYVYVHMYEYIYTTRISKMVCLWPSTNLSPETVWQYYWCPIKGLECVGLQLYVLTGSKVTREEPTSIFISTCGTVCTYVLCMCVCICYYIICILWFA